MTAHGVISQENGLKVKPKIRSFTSSTDGKKSYRQQQTTSIQLLLKPLRMVQPGLKSEPQTLDPTAVTICPIQSPKCKVPHLKQTFNYVVQFSSVHLKIVQQNFWYTYRAIIISVMSFESMCEQKHYFYIKKHPGNNFQQSIYFISKNFYSIVSTTTKQYYSHCLISKIHDSDVSCQEILDFITNISINF